MDEPFGALDAQTRESMQAELLDIHARTGKTILFVTHDLDEAVLIADRIVVMKNGRVQEIMEVPLKRPRPDLGLVRGTPEFAETRYKVWRAMHDGPRCTDGRISQTRATNRSCCRLPDEREDRPSAKPLPRWVDHARFHRGHADPVGDIRPPLNPVFGSYPWAIAVAFWELLVSGHCGRRFMNACGPSCSAMRSRS